MIVRLLSALVALATMFGGVDGGIGFGTPAPAVRVATVDVGPPPSTFPPAPAGVPCPEWLPAALEAGWTLDEWPTLGRIMFRESRCFDGATHHNTNGSVDRGLLQINSVHRAWLAGLGVTLDDLLDGPTNLRAGRELFDLEGWRPWATN